MYLSVIGILVNLKEYYIRTLMYTFKLNIKNNTNITSIFKVCDFELQTMKINFSSLGLHFNGEQTYALCLYCHVIQ